MKDVFSLLISFTPWTVSEIGPLVLEFINLWSQNPDREPLHLYRKNIPVSPITLESVSANVKNYDSLYLKLKSSLKRDADVVDFHVVKPYPLMQEKYPDGVYGITSNITVNIALNKIGKKSGYYIEEFINLGKSFIKNKSVRRIDMDMDTKSMMTSGYYSKMQEIGKGRIWWVNTFAYFSSTEMKKQFDHVGGEEVYLSVCRKHHVQVEFSPEYHGYFLHMPFDFQDTPELHEAVLAFNQDLYAKLIVE
ncbi:hypothetical protein [Anaeromassilibacillus sp. An200]|uniref:hypothetical protein n=1 Tax=Anaeromassilibacillus sp. An200 TaxID=1965587 RepID=UPI000B3ADB71|nr:hypothetical protein [Anaeromassilibacillus sp. An200]OUP04259.1 hypothetical protein B5F35_17690 [Anaeromassilibacillus sp. An200]